MRVVVQDVSALMQKAFPEERSTLYLAPENDEDRKTLEKLLGGYVCVGCGFDAKTGRPLHVELELKPREPLENLPRESLPRESLYGTI